MIARLTGRLIEQSLDHVILSVQGVGYRVQVSTETLAALGSALRSGASGSAGAEVTLRIHTHVREDAIELFGFHEANEEAVFRALLSIPKIGCKKAMGLLSSITAAAIVAAVRAEDAPRLSKAPGVGKKTAERLVLELSGKLDGLAGDLGEKDVLRPAQGPVEDVVAGLLNLGYRVEAAREAAEAVCRETGAEERELGTLLRLALRRLRSP